MEPVPAEKQIGPAWTTPSWRSWPTWAGASRRSTATRATWNGRGRTAASGCLQARPITTAGAAEREQVRREEIAALAAKAEPGGTVWSRFNLSESLPEPTPMTWAIVRRFMSGRGGYGLMYRDLGFEPDPSVDDDGTYDLVAGRPYCNLSREPRFYAGWLPYEHPFAALKADPQKALYPQPTLNAARFGLAFLAVAAGPPAVPRRRVDRVGPQAVAADADLRRPLPPRGAARLRRRGGQGRGGRPRRAGTAGAAGTAGTLDAADAGGLRPRQPQADGPGRRSPCATWRTSCAAARPRAARAAAVGALTTGVRPDPEADLPGAMSELAAGRLDRAGVPAALRLARQPGDGAGPAALVRGAGALDRVLDQMSGPPNGTGRASGRGAGGWPLAEARFAEDLAAGSALEPDVRSLQTYLGLRETAKHYLMRGYALIRRVLLELDRRYRLAGRRLLPDAGGVAAVGQREKT